MVQPTRWRGGQSRFLKREEDIPSARRQVTDVEEGQLDRAETARVLILLRLCKGSGKVKVTS
jgi:hypothetical protein